MWCTGNIVGRIYHFGKAFIAFGIWYCSARHGYYEYSDGVCGVGLGQGLIQKKDANEEDFSTALIGNIFLAITLYTGVFIAAPVIAGFYSMSDLVLVIRVLGINILVGGMKGILHADIQRKMQFRKFFNATIIGTIISAFVGIFMAIRGMSLGIGVSTTDELHY